MRELLAGEADAEGEACVFEHAGHAERKRMRDLRAFAEPGADQIAEVLGFVVEAAMLEGLIQFDDAAAHVVNGSAAGIPPVGVNPDEAPGTAEQCVAQAEQVEAGV